MWNFSYLSENQAVVSATLSMPIRLNNFLSSFGFCECNDKCKSVEFLTSADNLEVHNAREQEPNKFLGG